MYSTHRGDERVRIAIDTPTFDSTAEGRAVPVLDVAASRTADRHTLFLKLVNTDLEQALEVDVRISGLAVRPRAERVTLAAGDLSTHTSFRAPDAIAPQADTVAAGDAFTLRLPAHSVSVITLQRAAAGQ
jgi:alpha-L-arabinofuranosidase